MRKGHQGREVTSNLRHLQHSQRDQGHPQPYEHAITDTCTMGECTWNLGKRRQGDIRHDGHLPPIVIGAEEGSYARRPRLFWSTFPIQERSAEHWTFKGSYPYLQGWGTVPDLPPWWHTGFRLTGKTGNPNMSRSVQCDAHLPYQRVH